MMKSVAVAGLFALVVAACSAGAGPSTDPGPTSESRSAYTEEQATKAGALPRPARTGDIEPQRFSGCGVDWCCSGRINATGDNYCCSFTSAGAFCGWGCFSSTC
jgi:hypothetical protein